MSLRIARRRREACLREVDRARDVRAKGFIEIRRRLFQLDLGTAERTEVVVNGHRPAQEQHVEPDDGCERAVQCGIVRMGGDLLAQQRDRLVMIEVVNEIESPRSYQSAFIAHCRLERRRETAPKREREDSGLHRSL